MVGKKSGSNLEEIVKEGLNFLTLKKIDEVPDLSKKIPEWYSRYAAPNYGEKEAGMMYDVIRRDPLSIKNMIEKETSVHIGNLVDEVRKNPLEVIKSLSETSMQQLALPFLGDDKYRELKKVIENGGNVVGAYAEIGDSPDWAYLVNNSTPEAVKGAAEAYLQNKLNMELAENLYSDGKFNKEKATNYIMKLIPSKNADRDNFYAGIGIAYAREHAKQD